MKSHLHLLPWAVEFNLIADALAGRKFDPSLMGDLESLANRGYTDGFFVRHHCEELQRYHENAGQRWKFAGRSASWGLEG